MGLRLKCSYGHRMIRKEEGRYFCQTCNSFYRVILKNSKVEEPKPKKTPWQKICSWFSWK